MANTQKILIVDDKPANLFTLGQILKETTAEIIRADSGNEALTASLNNDFALAIVDVQMPEMDGYELAELLRSEKKTRELPIIFVSAVYSSEYHVFKGYAAGAVDFLVKPYNAHVLLSKVKVFLQLDHQQKLLLESRNRLTLANDTLEVRVRERTSDLEKAIEELRKEIKKRVKAEEDIRKAKKEWQEIFEAIGHVTMILDRDFSIIAANRATLKHTGLTLESILGRKCYTLFHGTEEAITKCPVAKMLGSEDLQVTESEVEALGKTFIVSCTPICDDLGQLDKIIHIATDISNQKRLKRELIQAHKMEAIGSLASGIAHDFNNILTAVMGFTEISLQQVEKDSEVAENLQQVYAAGIRARDLVGQILNFARKTDDEPQPVRVDLIAKEVAKFLRSTIPANIEIKQDLMSGSYIMANPVKIHQLLMNLCTNAAYAMCNGGALGLSLHDVVLTETDLPADKKIQPGHYQRLEVSDTGIGISPDIMNSIFEPFFTTKGINEGTGMGLAMVHDIVKGTGGDVSVESRVGKGTVFTILLPTTNAQEIQARITSEQLPSGSENILIVDDEPAICKLACRMLEGYGYKVVSETSSERALLLFAGRPDAYDLIITDLTMPKLTGDKLTTEILAIRPDMPVIITTGYSSRIPDTKAVDVGAKVLLPKPFEKKTLIITVRKVLDEAATSREGLGEEINF